MGVSWYFRTVLICISTSISDPGSTFLTYLVGHLCVFFWQMLFQILCPFSTWIVLAFLLLRFAVS